jgi:hypothetical protein
MFLFSKRLHPPMPIPELDNLILDPANQRYLVISPLDQTKQAHNKRHHNHQHHSIQHRLLETGQLWVINVDNIASD